MNLGPFGPNFFVVDRRAVREHRGGRSMAGVHRLHREQRPFPVTGDRGLGFLAAARQRSPLDELTVRPLSPLRCGPVPSARSSPRSPASPDAGPLEDLTSETPKPWSDRSGSNAAPVAALWSAWCHAARRAAAAQFTRPPALCWSSEEARAARAPNSPPQSPHGAPIHR